MTTERLLGHVARPFSSVEKARLGALLERIGSARVVLIGEASHGTSEFYRMRQRITRALIETRGFSIVAIEADWPDAEHVDAWVRARDAKSRLDARPFAGFPTWMWRNAEVLQFVSWLRAYNQAQPEGHQVAFRGLDIYSLFASIQQVLRYLRTVDAELASLAQRRYDCFEPFRSDPTSYGSAVITDRYRDCENEAAGMLDDLLRHRLRAAIDDRELSLDAEQNARVVSNAEKYYRSLFYAGPESWNLRDQHMFETLEVLLSHAGPHAKAVVWAHNSHLGDARATELSTRGETNLGALCRQRFGDDVYAIGFGTHTGTVAAASSWGGPVEFKEVRPSHPDSYERIFHDTDVPSFFLPLRSPDHPDVRDALSEPLLQRAIGVIYRPETELESHYFTASLARQFDEYVWFDETTHVEPIGVSHAPDLPERHPFLLGD